MSTATLPVTPFPTCTPQALPPAVARAGSPTLHAGRAPARGSAAWAWLTATWRRWRAEQRREQEMRYLRRLDPRLLKDVGLGEFAPPAGVSWIDLERGRW